MTAYYNEFDVNAAAWLRELIKAGLIAPGEVDERDIRDVRPSELAGFTQCHFFAGIGVWSYALRRAGWLDDRPVWTGSCPCQPFSAAGRHAGLADERHLWPAFYHLISERRPGVVFGEQVASKDGLAWLDIVQADMEGAGYAIGATDLCAAGVGAPHIRQRLWFVADADGGLTSHRHIQRGGQHRQQQEDGCAVLGLVDPRGEGSGRHARALSGEEGSAGGSLRSLADELELAGADGVVGDADDARSQGQQQRRLGADQWAAWAPGVVGGFWRDADLILCRDAKWRPVEPGSFPLAHGAPARVGRLRGYGNAIVVQAAEEVIRAYLLEGDVG